jgi:hypothetical protein
MDISANLPLIYCMYMNTNTSRATVPLSSRQKNSDYWKLLISDKDFQRKVSGMRNEFNIQKDGTFDFTRMDEYAKSVTKLCRSMNLPTNFDIYVSRYILHGLSHFPMTNFNVVVDEKTSSEVTTKVYTKLTEAEYADMRRETEKISELPSFQPIKDLDKKIHREKAYEEVAKLNEDPDKEYIQTVSEYLGKGTAKRAYENVRELRDHRQKRFGKYEV